MSTSVYKLENFKMGYKSATKKSRNTPEKVKRLLFGPVDHESNRIFIENELNTEYNRGCRKWNFNFREEIPLDDGDYIWTSPSPVLINKKRKPTEAPDNSSAYYFQPIEGSSGPSTDFPEPIKPVARSPEVQSRSHRIQRQSQITDYMVKSKRPASTVHLKDMMATADERPKKIRKTFNCSS